MIKFEKVSKFKNTEIELPSRATEASAGYDFIAAEDVVIEPYFILRNRLRNVPTNEPLTLDEVAAITKQEKARPTLISTGVKCQMPLDHYLQLSVRSSGPLKHWLIMGNSVGVIDADYYNNEDNEGEIFFQIINLSPFHIHIKKGDKIGQGIILPYKTTDDDSATGVRAGGFGSTSK